MFLLFTGQECLINGKFNEAVEAFTEAFSTDPSNKRFNKLLHELRGEANLHLHDYAAAFQDFSESLKDGDKKANVLYMRACCHHAMGQFEDCIIDCQASLALQWTVAAQTLMQDVFNLTESHLKCPYDTLGLTKNAGMEEIKAAYKSMSLKFHPQQYPKATEEEIKKLEWKFEEVAKAFVTLSKPKAKLVCATKPGQCKVSSNQPPIAPPQPPTVHQKFRNPNAKKKKDDCSIQ